MRQSCVKEGRCILKFEEIGVVWKWLVYLERRGKVLAGSSRVLRYLGDACELGRIS
jgi:hypothetical protein